MITLKVGSQLVKFYTIGDFSRLIDRSIAAIYKYEKRGILPRPNYYRKRGIKSERLYSKMLAEKVAQIFREDVKQGVKINSEVISKLIAAFREEKEMYSK